MALSGSQTAVMRNATDYEIYYTFSWQVLEQSTLNNTSTLYWEVKGWISAKTDNVPTTAKSDFSSVVINGVNYTPSSYVTTLYYGERNTIIASGRVVLSHNSSGACSLSYTVKSTFRTMTSTSGLAIDTILTKAEITNNPTFNDEENVTINYGLPTNRSDVANVTKLEVCISTSNNDTEPVVAYREAGLGSTTYTFNFTDAERKALRQSITTGSSKKLYFFIKTTISGSARKHYTNGLLNLINHEPTLNPVVKDISPETLALTGNENVFIRYESMIEFATGAEARKEAEIATQSVQCGNTIITDMYNGVIDDIESGEFIFNATDSRGINSDTYVVNNVAMIEYVKPTCAQNVKIELDAENTVKITLTNSGLYYSGSFGVANNEMLLEVRYKSGSGEYGNWIALTDTPSFNNNNFELTSVFEGLPYKDTYTFQTRLTDKLNTVITSAYVVKLYPVFDWGENDFNFNVPVNIGGDAAELNMNGETVLRHNADANNTVLSASGGKIYFRPSGTNSTAGETVIHQDGSIDFGGAVDFGGSFTIGGYTLNDYVIDSGTEAMGTNGTWYWQKWASGKSECWGCRNFGNMAITTTWGNLYRSAIFSQALPEDVFITTPDVINISIVNSNYGGWVCKHEQNAPSAITTGSFIVVRPAAATITPSYIGFHIIGLWKQ